MVVFAAATQLFKLLHKYRPETKVQKRERLRAVAVKKSEGGDVTPGKKPITIKYGINHITSLVEQKKAQLVVIAHDVDPIEVGRFLFNVHPQFAQAVRKGVYVTKSMQSPSQVSILTAVWRMRVGILFFLSLSMVLCPFLHRLWCFFQLSVGRWEFPTVSLRGRQGLWNSYCDCL